MNLTEAEAKVREATNNEPWGASTSLMAQIAQGTHNYREREEVVGFIFRRFTEKAANEWRQIYKLLQLLEYLIKNGNERVIDDVRANVLLLQMLKLFHYIDSKGRDQGINVRNRVKTLLALMGDDALIRSERKKAKANAAKFGAVLLTSYGGSQNISSQGSYGDDDLLSRVYGDGGVYGDRYGDPALEYTGGSSLTRKLEEYDENAPRAAKTSSRTAAKASSRTAAATSSTQAINAGPEPDLLGDLIGGTNELNIQENGNDDDDDDDFDDFQAAPSQPDKPLSNLANLYQTNQQMQPQYQGQFQGQAQPNQGQLFLAQQAPSQYQSQPMQGQAVAAQAQPQKQLASPAAYKAASSDAFSSLFSSAKSSAPQKTPISVPAKNTFSAETSRPHSTPIAQPAKPQANSEEVDLLSF